MPQAKWNGQIIAKSDETIEVEGNHYFPAESLSRDLYKNSKHRTICGWKGEASYLSLEIDGKINENAAWYYPEPKEAAKQIEGYVAFWKGVEVTP